jgi:transposase
LRSRHQAKHALCADQVARATELLEPSSHAAPVHSPADGDHYPRAPCRVRIVAPVGRRGVEQLLKVVVDDNDTRLPEIARVCVAALGTQLLALKAQILAFDRHIMAWHRSNETSKRLDAIPGGGPALATALVASVGDPKAFRSGRDFSAWIGLVPKQNSSGGKDRLGNISKQGGRYLRSLFTAGALAVIRYAKLHGTEHRPWLTALLARRPTKVAAIARRGRLRRPSCRDSFR